MDAFTGRSDVVLHPARVPAKNGSTALQDANPAIAVTATVEIACERNCKCPSPFVFVLTKGDKKLPLYGNPSGAKSGEVEYGQRLVTDGTTEQGGTLWYHVRTLPPGWLAESEITCDRPGPPPSPSAEALAADCNSLPDPGPEPDAPPLSFSSTESFLQSVWAYLNWRPGWRGFPTIGKCSAEGTEGARG
jgi:hypothetical protein